LWREAGYFDNAAETKPLLHLWSLGIEEQFYIVWPIILWAFWRFKAIRLPLIALLTSGSFAWNIYQSQVDLTHDFYSPLTRFWELSAGAWLAFHLSRRSQAPQSANVISARAVMILLAAVYVVDSKKAFPGGWALLPVVGAVLLIYAGPLAWFNKVLFSNRAMVWVGAISYPLYLWHWPALAFARIVEGATPSVSIRLGAVVLSIFLAWLTFVCIEKPLRFGWKSALRTPLLILAMAVLGYVGLACKNSAGYPDRPIMQANTSIVHGEIEHGAFDEYYSNKFHPCRNNEIRAKSKMTGSMVRCFETKNDEIIDLFVIGDSHADHLLAGLAMSFPDLNIALYTRNDLPFIDSEQYQEVFDALKNIEKDSKNILISSMWAVAPLDESEKLEFNKRIEKTINSLLKQGWNIYITDDTPKFGFDSSRCKFNNPLTGKNQCAENDFSYQAIRDSYVPYMKSISEINPKHVKFVDLSNAFCDGNYCYMGRGNEIYFRDNNHLNILGSIIIGEYISDKMRGNR
jgi:hypothetical protein